MERWFALQTKDETKEHNVDVPMPQIVETGRVKEENQLITRDKISNKLAKLEKKTEGPMGCDPTMEGRKYVVDSDPRESADSRANPRHTLEDTIELPNADEMC